MCESDLLDESKANLGNKMDDNLDDKNRKQSDNDNDNDNDTVILNDKTSWPYFGVKLSCVCHK